jgi:hypothetical protein
LFDNVFNDDRYSVWFELVEDLCQGTFTRVNDNYFVNASFVIGAFGCE